MTDRCAYACSHASPCVEVDGHAGNHHCDGCADCARRVGDDLYAGVAQNAGAAGINRTDVGTLSHHPARITVEDLPSILVSFAYRKPWTKVRDLPHWREVVLDSGVYTFRKQGKLVDVQEFGEWALAELARDPRVTESFNVDQGDWREQIRTCERLWTMGVRCMPVYHVGDPVDALRMMARDYPKIAIGGSVGYRKRHDWAALCFREVWPKKIHGLGYGETAIRRLPFHSVDNSSWIFAPTQFGNFHSMPNLNRGERTTRRPDNVRCEIDFFLREEERARRWWAGRVPADFGAMPSIRLATTCDRDQMESLGTPVGGV